MTKKDELIDEMTNDKKEELLNEALRTIEQNRNELK